MPLKIPVRLIDGLHLLSGDSFVLLAQMRDRVRVVLQTALAVALFDFSKACARLYAQNGKVSKLGCSKATA